MGRRYAILVSFDLERLTLHQRTESEALVEMSVAMAARGFATLLPGLYGGAVDAVKAITAVQDLAESLPWLAPCTREARLLRIEEDSDLTIAFK